MPQSLNKGVRVPKALALLALLATGLACNGPAAAQSDYYRHVVFDNSRQSDLYYWSSADASAPSRCNRTSSALASGPGTRQFPLESPVPR